jgi:hypothetical protein
MYVGGQISEQIRNEERDDHEGVSKIFWIDAVKIINLTTKHMWKPPTSIQLRPTWHTDSIDMVVLPSTGASCYHNCCIDGSTVQNILDKPSYIVVQMHYLWYHHSETSALQAAWIAMSKEKTYRTDHNAYTCNHMAHKDFHLQLQLWSTWRVR